MSFELPLLSLLGASTAGFMGLTAASVALSRAWQNKLLGPSGGEPSGGIELADTLPFDHMDADGVTVWCKNGTPTRVISLRGVLSEALTPEEAQRLLGQCQKWLRDVAEAGLSLKVITVRQEVERQVPATYENPYLQALHDRWMASFGHCYVNSHALVLAGEPFFPSFKERCYQRWGVKSPRGLKGTSGLPPGLPAFKAAEVMTLEGLQAFGPQLLKNDGPSSPLLTFWGRLLHGDQAPLRPAITHLSDRLVGASLTFDTAKGTLRWQQGSKIQWGAILSMNRWDDTTSPHLMKELMALPGRLICWQQLKGFPKMAALLRLMDQKKQSTLAWGAAKTGEEFDAALELIQADETALYQYQGSVLLMADREEALATLLHQARQIFRTHGVIPLQETQALPYAWRSLFPCSGPLLRPTTLLAHNVANLLNFSQDAPGLEQSDWGPGPLRLFPTASGSPYALQLHVSEEKEALGHSLVIAPAGSGKTTLFQHIMAGALRHKALQAYIFDRFHGTQIFTQSVGGTYVALGAGTDTPGVDTPRVGPPGVPLNPFLAPDTPQERAFLCQFLQLLAGLTTPESFDEASLAVDMLFRVPPAQRVLTTLYVGLFSAYGGLKKRLAPWVGQGIYASWFNGMKDGEAYDALSFDSRLVTFEMTDAQASPLTAAALTAYLLHRIRTRLWASATPHMIFMDEAAPMLQHDHFREAVAVLFKEHRKLRGSVTVCFQTVVDVVQTGIASVILEQCPTRFLFPNPAAKREDYALLDVTETEWAYIKGESRLAQTLKHSVLLKRPQESVILNIAMGSLGPYLKLYKSGSEAVTLVHTLQRQWGSQWIDPYLNTA